MIREKLKNYVEVKIVTLNIVVITTVTYIVVMKFNVHVFSATVDRKRRPRPLVPIIIFVHFYGMSHTLW